MSRGILEVEMFLGRFRVDEPWKYFGVVEDGQGNVTLVLRDLDKSQAVQALITILSYCRGSKIQRGLVEKTRQFFGTTGDPTGDPVRATISFSPSCEILVGLGFVISTSPVPEEDQLAFFKEISRFNP